MEDVDTSAPQVILGDFVGDVMTCLSLVKETGSILTGGGLCKYFGGQEFVPQMDVYCPSEAVPRWRVFLEADGLEFSCKSEQTWVCLRFMFLFAVANMDG